MYCLMWPIHPPLHEMKLSNNIKSYRLHLRAAQSLVNCKMPNSFHFILSEDTFQIKCYIVVTSGLYPALSAFLHCFFKYGPNPCRVYLIAYLNLIHVLKQSQSSKLFFFNLLYVFVVCCDTFKSCYSAKQAQQIKCHVKQKQA